MRVTWALALAIVASPVSAHHGDFTAAIDGGNQYVIGANETRSFNLSYSGPQGDWHLTCIQDLELRWETIDGAIIRQPRIEQPFEAIQTTPWATSVNLTLAPDDTAPGEYRIVVTFRSVECWAQDPREERDQRISFAAFVVEPETEERAPATSALLGGLVVLLAVAARRR